MQVGITGATGFVGFELTRQLIAQGHQVIAWHRPSSDLTQFQSWIQQGTVRCIEGSLEDVSNLDWLNQCDMLVHSGLWRESVSFQQSPSSVSRYAEINIIGTLKLIEAAIRSGLSRFVFVSTCAVHDLILDDRPLDEAHPLWAKSHYGAHKAAIEKFVHSFGLGDGYPICALRPTGIYGIQQPPERSKWHALIQSVSRGEDVTTSRGGKEVHVTDVARAIRLLLDADESSIQGQSFACYDRYISEFEVASIAKSLTGSSSVISGQAKQPKHQIDTRKLRDLGMSFGGEPLLQETIGALISAEMA